MDYESFIGAFGDVPEDLAGDYGQLFIFRTEDFGAWYRRVRDAHEREVDTLRDETYVDTMSDAQLAEHGLVRLPTDADGVPIHVGDVMEWCDSGETLTVEGIGRDVLFYIDGENAEWTAARNKRHHHAPTVEDVLREFAEKVIDSQIPSVHPTYEEAITEYAAMLRLADDAE